MKCRDQFKENKETASLMSPAKFTITATLSS